MNDPSHKINEARAAEAFTKQSSLFDELYSSDKIIQYKRKRVREHVEQFLRPNSRILELNAGTGEDAIYFAKKGHTVHATDISEGMLDILLEKVNEHGVSSAVTAELCSYTELGKLQRKGPFDLIFSNFAGLNCTAELDKVLLSLESLLEPGGTISLVILPRFCLWESLLVFRGKFKTAFRRLLSQNGARSHIEGQYFRCWYYNPSFVRKVLKKSFRVVGLEGLCTLVPPSYIEHFAEKYPRLFRLLSKKENRLKNSWPWKNIGDYYIISLKKRM